MSFPLLGDSGIYIISDTILCDGTGVLMTLLKTFKKKVTFLSDSGNFGHFNTLLKKNLIQSQYFELENNIEAGDLPLTENPPITWLDAPKRVKIDKILPTLDKQVQDIIVFDDIYSILLELGPQETVKLLFFLKSLCKALVVKGNKEVITQIWPVEQVSKATLELSPLESGTSSECLGKIRFEYRENLVKSEIGVYYYKLLNDNFILIDYLAS